MNFWNWLAIAAFAIALMGGLNAFLSLKTRYRDWRGTRNHKSFEKRLKELRKEFAEVENYHKNKFQFFSRVLEEATKPLVCIVLALILFIGAFAIYRIPLPGFRPAEFLYLVFAIAILFLAMPWIQKMSRLITNVGHPDKLVKEIIDFIKESRLRKIIPIQDETFLDKVIFSSIFDEEQSHHLNFYRGSKELEAAQELFTKAEDLL